ncbi:MAG: diguanylate cyclase [Gammaproteobacteria bacterium]|nr:diguanylate cyclase [Gammaproteobacteria bacterium]
MSNKPRLLIADDSEHVRKEMLTILEDEYDLVQAENGDQAWSLISNDTNIKMVFTDLTMPKSDGLSLLRRIRGDQDEKIRVMPVIMMTDAQDSLTTVKESLAAGVTDLVRKPFIPELLRARANANIKPNLEKQYVVTATVDPLTQLANEPYFMLRGANNLSYAIRHNSGFGVMMIRIDHFEELQKAYEPYVMESVQVKVGSYISSVVRLEDTVARLDAGVFGVLLQGVDPRGVLESASRIQQKVKKKAFRFNDQRFSITISIGAAAPALKPYSSFELILRQARSELGTAVKLGGDQIEAANIYQRLTGEDEASHYVPSLDEALEMLNNNQGQLLGHCADELFGKLLPLLMYCDDKMQLNLITQIKERLQSRSGETT